MTESIHSQLARAGSPLLRELNNVVIDKLSGRSVQCLKITRVSYGMSGDSNESLETEILNKVFVKFPSNELELRYKYDEEAQKLDSTSIDLWDLLPIEITIPFKIDNNTTQIINLKRGDKIVIPVFDEFYEDGTGENNVMPIIAEVEKLKGTFIFEHITHKRYELTIYRAQLETDIQVKVDEFVDSLKEQDGS